MQLSDNSNKYSTSNMMPGSRRGTYNTKSKKSMKKIKSERSYSEISLESTTSMNHEGERIKPHYREIPLREMMRYYQPQWLAYVGFAASIVSAF